MNEFQRMQKLAGLITESEYHKSSVNEISTGGLDTEVLYNFIEKHGDSFAGTDTSELESVKGKELFLDDLLTTQDGLSMLSGKLPKFAEALKKYNIKLNLNKANIEHPNVVANIYDALIKPGIITLDDLKNVPNIVVAADAKSADWSDEVINKLKDQKHINAAQILRGTALNENIKENEEAGSILGNTGYDGELAVTIQALEDYLKTNWAKLDYQELESLVVDIVNAAKSDKGY
jgi:hypothetical protein